MSEEETTQFQIAVRLAMSWLIDPGSVALEALSDEAQKIVKAVRQRVPIPGLDHETQALIDAQLREDAELRKAQEIVSFERAKKRAKEMLRRESGGPVRTWAPVDITAAWEAADGETQTDVGYLSGDMPIGIFYRGKINGVHAESEAGKSWFACLVVVQEIRAGRYVAYIDFEDDAASIVRRLKLLGASRRDVVTFFHYYSPTGPLAEEDEREFQQLISIGGTLVVFDGMTESMAIEGLKGNDAEDVAAWHAKLTKPFAAAGWAVVVLDHVPHDGKRAIGSQHKKSALTGVSYFLEPVRPIGKGVAGKSRLKVEKDRGAWVRSHAIPGRTPQHFADLVIDFDGKSMPTADLWPARPAENKGYKSEPPERVRNDVLSFVAESPGASKSAIRRAVTGGNGDIDWALEWLIDHDQVSVKQVGQAKKHYPADPAGTVP
ncbi:AAA family ATPase [Streptomyces rhizosphaericus]|uniref:AAA family ATPase n=1 Tax=Streptomyces rhizosphaericus TaxID=114699 RepID=A0A6G4ATZ8_9ACTN|nr:AAA family ATPase [Streptomyces rhizosphaericus]NEW76244.1 AAA family ATPase [Streptomyces rhizosphaericus]